MWPQLNQLFFGFQRRLPNDSITDHHIRGSATANALRLSVDDSKHEPELKITQREHTLS